MCQWALQNPDAEPDIQHVAAWVLAANEKDAPNPHIVIANTPESLPPPLARALMGGAAHEAFHTLYSPRRALSTEEMAAIILPRWSRVPKWGVLAKFFLLIMNLVDDIFIERNGSRDYPGTIQDRHDLFDFAIDQNAENQRKNPGYTGPTALEAVLKAMYFLGAGHHTPKVLRNIEEYEKAFPIEVALVRTGPLAPLLEQAASLGAGEGIQVFRIAMDLVAEVYQLAQEDPPPPPELEPEPEEKEPEPEGKEPEPETPENEEPEQDFTEAAANILEEILTLPDLPNYGDVQQAVEAALQFISGQQFTGMLEGEFPWAPYDQSLDKIQEVRPSRRGKEEDQARARELVVATRKAVAFLRARLRNKVRAMELVSVAHGLPHGTDLSERYLVDSYISLRDGEVPKRAFKKKGAALDESLAAVVVLDESSSVAWSKIQTLLAQITLALTDTFDSLGCPVMAVGVQNGKPCPDASVLLKENPDLPEHYHRLDGVLLDVFKTFEEKLTTVQWRFANTEATGSTPLADGMHFALSCLRPRREKYRVMFVVTDGEPDRADVVRWLLRKARKQGVHVVGVGAGPHTEYLKILFSDFEYGGRILPGHIWASSFEELPVECLRVVGDLLDADKRRG